MMANVSTWEILTRMPEGQFDEVLFRTNVPREYLSAPSVARATRVRELMDWAGQSPENLARLQRAIVPDRATRRSPAEQRPAPRAVRAPVVLDPLAAPVFDADGLDSSAPSRSPIVIALEERDAPLAEDHLLKTERHVTVTLSAEDLAAFDQISARLHGAPGAASILQDGRTGWEILSRAQSRLTGIVERLIESRADQPVAWTGRAELLLRLYRAIQIVHPFADNELTGILSVASGAHYFWPVEDPSQERSVRPLSSGSLRTGLLNASSDGAAGALAEAGTFDVVVATGDDLTAALRPLVESAAKGCTRVAVTLGDVELNPKHLRDVLSRIPCLSVGGASLPEDALLPLLKSAFGARGARHAAPCILAAVRKTWIEQNLPTFDGDTLLDALLWSTWSWVGRPLFAREYGELRPGPVPHLMDLRSVAGKGWYFKRSAGMPKTYTARELARTDLAPAARVHMYVSGAGGTGKSCFLRHVYELFAERSHVIPVWYRVDAPSSSWEEVERRLREEIVEAASQEDRLGAEGRDLLPKGELGGAVREAARKLRALAPDWELVIFIDQLERTFESGDEPDLRRLADISSEITSLLKTVEVGQGVRVFIASRKQYLPDFLQSYEAAHESGLHFNVLQTISEGGEQEGFVLQVLQWCQEQNLVGERVEFEKGVPEMLARKVNGHPLNMMLALIQLFSEPWQGVITEEAVAEKRPWERLFDLDLRAVDKDDIDWYFVLAMAHARTEIVRFEEVWWRLRLVDPTLTRRVDELRPRGVLERLWLVGHLGRTIHPRPHLGDPARFLEFFHANLRDFLLREVMGPGGADLRLLGRRRETPSAWRALDRLSTFAHEWEQMQQQLPYDDIRVLMEHRDVVVERIRWEQEPEREPFSLLFLRDSARARDSLCQAAKECFAFSALVHDQFGKWAIETLFADVDSRIACCARWLRRCQTEARAPILRYLIQMKAAAAREFLTSLVLPDGEPLASGLALDLGSVLTEPLHAARFRNEIVAAVLERGFTRALRGVPAGQALPEAVGEFVVAACAASRNDLVNVLAHCATRFEGSPDERLRRAAARLSAEDLAAEWLAKTPGAALRAPAEARERHGRVTPIVQLVVGANLLAAIDEARAAEWHVMVRDRLGVPIPSFEIGAGEVEANELELRVRGERIAIGRFFADRSQVLKRHWERTQPSIPPEAYDTQNDALGEVVFWLTRDLLSQIGWELPAQDFDRAVVDWLEEMLRNSIDRLFDLNVLIEFVNGVAAVVDSSRLFRGITLFALRNVLVDLVQERVPLVDRGGRIVQQLQIVAQHVKDHEILTQKIREHVKDDLCRTFADDAGQVATLMLDESFETLLSSQVVGSDDGPVLRIDPGTAGALAAALRRHFERNLRDDVKPVVVCATKLRKPLSRLLRRFDPRIHVLSFTELSQEVIPVPAGLIEAPKSAPV
jgi:hypothetical protein